MEKHNEISNTNIERRNITGKVEIRSEGEGQPMVVTGTAVVFNTETDMGWYNEKVAADAFTECDMTDVLALKNHDEDEILSRTTDKPDDLQISVSADGLQYTFTVKNECAKRCAEDVALGFIRGSSFGFITRSDAWEYDVKQTDGSTKDVRTILKIEKLYDVSPVTFPAYPTTTVAARSRDLNKPKPTPPTGAQLAEQYKLETFKNKK